MATIINITQKIKQEPKFIKIGEATYQVNDSKNNMIEAMGLMSNADGDVKAMDLAVKKLLGAKAFAEIEKLNLTFDSYKVVFIGIMAAVNELTYEEAEARFRKQEQQ